ncbi:Asp-tRNA(Asn)/Glu-tRNA(Gln) amidotransferase subunit GatC [Candidatus Nomurabacteria bacterium]|nr:Asp-tRNA(Asn)/Glu-tRNA(Gln) amidotransferase subunit GatC [Candidatus Nomurabacteria bacterium]
MEIKDVENLANLSRIELSEEEKQEILKDMKGILEYVKVVEGVQVEDTKPEYNLRNVWRDDEIIPREFSHELITEQFPASQDGFLKVKKIL